MKLQFVVFVFVIVSSGWIFAGTGASAQTSVTINSFSVTPTLDEWEDANWNMPMANEVSEYTIDFTTSAAGGLQGGVDDIFITFPDQMQLPENIDPDSVIVNGISCGDIAFDGDAHLSDHTLTVVVPQTINGSSECTIVITQTAGIANPQLSQELVPPGAQGGYPATYDPAMALHLDGVPDDLYELSISTTADPDATIQEFQVFDWLEMEQTEFSFGEMVTVTGAGFLPNTTVTLNGLTGGPLAGTGEVNSDGTVTVYGFASGAPPFVPLEGTDGSGRASNWIWPEYSFQTDQIDANSPKYSAEGIWHLLPSLSLSPKSGLAGSPVTLTGTNWTGTPTAVYPKDITIGGIPLYVDGTPVMMDRDGDSGLLYELPGDIEIYLGKDDFNVEAHIPRTLESGDYEVAVTGGDSLRCLPVSFDSSHGWVNANSFGCFQDSLNRVVFGLPPLRCCPDGGTAVVTTSFKVSPRTLTIEPEVVTPGANVTLSGEGFPAGEPLNYESEGIDYDGNGVTSFQHGLGGIAIVEYGSPTQTHTICTNIEVIDNGEFAAFGGMPDDIRGGDHQVIVFFDPTDTIYHGLADPEGDEVSSVAQFETPEIIYVNASNAGIQNGESWQTAYRTLQPALDDAGSGCQIWVAAGTYVPTTVVGGTGSRYQAFQMKSEVGIYGGFPRTGNPAWTDRYWQVHETIVTGDIGVRGKVSDNCYHVFYHPIGTNLDNSAILDGFTITQGNANGAWGEHMSLGGGMYNRNVSPQISNCIFTRNYAGDGGGIFNWDASPTLTNCMVINNTAEWGGGMYNLRQSPCLTSCTFNGNHSNKQGGGIYNDYSDPIFMYCVLTSNTADEEGGGIYNTHADPVLANCVLAQNEATKGGGTYNTESSPVINSGTFSGNYAIEGGGIYNRFNSSPSLTDCAFVSNTGSQNGGGLTNYQSSPTINNVRFNGNHAEDGGAIQNWDGSSPQITNCTFSLNAAARGGGIQNHGGCSPSIRQCIFNENVAVESGGAVFSYGGSPSFTDCIFTQNNAIDGGALYGTSLFPPIAPFDACLQRITDCIFYQNTANEGGAISSYNTHLRIANSVFDRNEAVIASVLSSYAVTAYGCDASLINCTLWENYRDQNPVITYDSFGQSYPSQVVVSNCILWNGGNEIGNNDSSNIAVTYSDILGGYPGNGNISGTPMFSDPASGDFRLMPSSPCINAGSSAAAMNAGIIEDWEGDPRIIGGGVDIGADEWSCWYYDRNGNGAIDYAEMVAALMDYLREIISYSNMVNTLMLYLAT